MRRYDLKRLKQRHDNSCGQTCVAMLALAPYDEVISYMGKGRTGISKIYDGLRKFGLVSPKKLISFRGNKEYANYKALDHDAILKLKTRYHKAGTHHWVVWDAKAKKLLDPMPDPYSVPPAKITHYLPIRCQRARPRLANNVKRNRS